jgi:TonB family protein
MSAGLLWGNIVAYSLQIGLVVALAAFLPAALHLRMPRARLLFWQILLAACVLLPLMRPLRQTVVTDKVEFTTTIISAMPASSSHSSFRLSRAEAALLLLAVGAFARLAWLGVGMWRLRRYRRHSYPLEPANSWSIEADLRISEDITSPVTFGFLHPVVLLPPQFPELGAAKRDAILCHEILHVRRRDWLFTIAEELLRAIFWFHPAIWWLLGEIQLTREQAVDREVIELTQSSDEYVDALLAMAGAHPTLDLAPAPLFLRRRHLKQRVVSILKEVRMSKTKWITTLTLATAMLAAACWFVTGALPLAAEPQMVSDGIGVTVDLNGAQLIHRGGVSYPREAIQNAIQGTVVVQAKVNDKGEVTDATVLSGPDELRKAAIRSVLDWHFAPQGGIGTRQVSIAFQLPKDMGPRPVEGIIGAVPSTSSGAVVGGVPGGVNGGVVGGVRSGVVVGFPAGTPRNMLPQKLEGTVTRIDIAGLSDQARSDLQSRLPLHQGDYATEDSLKLFREVVSDFDSHLGVHFGWTQDKQLNIHIQAPGAIVSTPQNLPAPAAMVPPGAVNVPGLDAQANLISQPHPMYPPLAKQARVSGVVTLAAVIGTDGHVKNLSVIKGHPLLIQAAIDAVRDWVYKPTIVNGQPVEVATQIDVNFTLNE